MPQLRSILRCDAIRSDAGRTDLGGEILRKGACVEEEPHGHAAQSVRRRLNRSQHAHVSGQFAGGASGATSSVCLLNGISTAMTPSMPTKPAVPAGVNRKAADCLSRMRPRTARHETTVTAIRTEIIGK